MLFIKNNSIYLQRNNINLTELFVKELHGKDYSYKIKEEIQFGYLILWYICSGLLGYTF